MTTEAIALKAVSKMLLKAEPARRLSDVTGEASEQLQRAGADREKLFAARLEMAFDADLADWGNGG